MQNSAITTLDIPASQRYFQNWYMGTADAVYQNIDIIRSDGAKYVMILSGDHVYQMDYARMLAEHVERGADMTVSCIEVPIEEAAGAFGVMSINDKGQVIAFEEKPSNPTPLPGQDKLTLASMGNYIFKPIFYVSN